MSDDFFLYEEADIPWNEKEKIRHEINTNYRKYWGLPMIVHRSVGFDGDYYLYYVENKGFDSYRFFARIKDLDEEDEVKMDNFRELLKHVDRSYDGFVHAVITYVKTPGNEKKKALIENFILSTPEANSSDVLSFMIEHTGFFDTVDGDRKSRKAVN